VEAALRRAVAALGLARDRRVGKNAGWLPLTLEPQVRVAASFGFDASTLRELVEVAQSNRMLIERTWHEYFG
jgi:hypothetical protein